jgi:hypothetical protein
MLHYEPTHVCIPHVFGGTHCLFGGTQGLKHHPVIVNKIARVTFMSKSGNKDRVTGLY